ncbi:hypothetical protein GCM10027093_09300 [Paraburkholderia jirisanensis]
MAQQFNEAALIMKALGEYELNWRQNQYSATREHSKVAHGDEHPYVVLANEDGAVAVYRVDPKTAALEVIEAADWPAEVLMQ